MGVIKYYYYLVEKYREHGKAKDRIIRRLTYEETKKYRKTGSIPVTEKLIKKPVSPFPYNSETLIKQKLLSLINQINSSESPFNTAYRPRPKSFVKKFLLPIIEASE